MTREIIRFHPLHVIPLSGHTLIYSCKIKLQIKMNENIIIAALRFEKTKKSSEKHNCQNILIITCKIEV